MVLALAFDPAENYFRVISPPAEPLRPGAFNASGLLRRDKGDLAMPDVTVNRRVSPRYQLILDAEITEPSSGARLSARTSDVSRGGCYVDTLNPIPAGKPIRIVLTHENETFEAPARVIYVSPGFGMGVHFEDPLPPQQLAILDHWLEAASRSAG
jgi:PilZ domain